VEGVCVPLTVTVSVVVGAHVLVVVAVVKVSLVIEPVAVTVLFI